MNELKRCDFCGREILWLQIKPKERVAVEPMVETCFTAPHVVGEIILDGMEHRFYRNHLDVCPV